MIDVRPFAELGHANHGWLDARYHFSFSQYFNPERMHWGTLRVWNDDTIAPGGGFPTHPHSDMEIITYVREGAITHKDSLGNVGRTEAGDVQVMSAGSGIRHSEYNLEPTETRLFQIWILPDRKGHTPSWGTRPFPNAGRDGQFAVLASGHTEDADALRLNTDARVLGASLKQGQTISYPLGKDRLAYLVVAKGEITIEGKTLHERDGAAIADMDSVTLTADADAELVMVETPPIT
ncbi:pirin [Acetobacter indonesiensis]|uniref:pirin family protein n=1 Tax=Acetobacter indonesiensis TaxID=104101 RepID=UPI000A3695BE|nr:pirin family protein [Acetobacter indonesiensis]OUI92511.1 pirin [Acetobacter indonesiensis]